MLSSGKHKEAKEVLKNIAYVNQVKINVDEIILMHNLSDENQQKIPKSYKQYLKDKYLSSSEDCSKDEESIYQD